MRIRSRPSVACVRQLPYAKVIDDQVRHGREIGELRPVGAAEGVASTSSSLVSVAKRMKTAWLRWALVVNQVDRSK